MQSLTISNFASKDELITCLWESGTIGIIEAPAEIQAFFSNDADLAELSRTYNCRVDVVPDEIPSLRLESPTKTVDPILAGDRFFIVPKSSEIKSFSGRTRIQINACNAFGSGSHESTQLVIRALEKYVRQEHVVVDVGSGSGILSAVCQLLGAGQVYACDTNLDSVFLTRRHAPAVHAFCGSIDSIRSSSVDIVIANISASVIDQLWHHLNRIAKPEGWLILAGFISERPPHSFAPTLETSMSEWLCWVCKPHMGASDLMSSAASPLQPFASEWW